MIPKIVKIISVFIFVMSMSLPGCMNSKGELPEELGGLKLSKLIRGNRAKRVVNKMHGKHLGATEYIIGYYGTSNSTNILYLSVYENADSAKADLMSMAGKMAKGTPEFTPITTVGDMKEHVRFRTEGMGLVHYFYRVDNMLLWWQVALDKEKETCEQLLGFGFQVPSRRYSQ
jgi:hypothetical protein